MPYRALLIVCLTAGVLASCSGPTASKEEFIARGDAFVVQKKYAEAVIEYRNAVAADQRDGQARRRLADAYEKTNDIERAYREYINAADLLPQDIELQLKATNYLIAADRYEDALTRADAILAIEPSHVDALVLKGIATAGLEDLDGALTAMEDAIRLDPKDPRSYAALGLVQMYRNKNAEAEEIFRRAAGLSGNSAAPHLALASYYWTTGKYADVETHVKKAVELEPDNPRAQRALGVFYITTGRASQAEVPLKAVANIRRDSVSRLALADYYTMTDRPAEARPILEEMVKTLDTRTGAVTRLAAMDHAAKRPADAYRRLDELLAKDPRNGEALQVKGKLLLADGKTDEALAAARTAAEALPESAEAHHLLGLAQMARGDRQAAIDAFTTAVSKNPRALVSKSHLANLSLAVDPAGAVRLAEEAAAAAPGSGGAQLTLVRALLRRGEVAKAEATLKTLLARSPNTALLHAQMGGIHMLRKNWSAAIGEFDRAQALDPDSSEALNGLVAIAVSQKNMVRARELVDRRLAKSPSDPRLLMLSANVAAAAGDIKGAEPILRRLIEVDPGNLQAYGTLASMYIQQNRMEAARREFELIVSRQPSNVAAQTMIGLLYEAEKKPAEARRVYEGLVGRSIPGTAVAANNLAWMYAETGGNLDQALELAQNATRQRPDVALFNHTLGRIYMKKDLMSLAIAPLEAAAQQDPASAEYHLDLGHAHAKAGNRVKARAAYREALRVKPQYPEAEQAIRGL